MFIATPLVWWPAFALRQMVNPTIEIYDEGCGIPPETLKGFYSGTWLACVGIASMRERIEGMDGLFDIGPARMER